MALFFFNISSVFNLFENAKQRYQLNKKIIYIVKLLKLIMYIITFAHVFASLWLLLYSVQKYYDPHLITWVDNYK
jgi:hypothetical protein